MVCGQFTTPVLLPCALCMHAAVGDFLDTLRRELAATKASMPPAASLPILWRPAPSAGSSDGVREALRCAVEEVRGCAGGKDPQLLLVLLPDTGGLRAHTHT